MSRGDFDRPVMKERDAMTSYLWHPVNPSSRISGGIIPSRRLLSVPYLHHTPIFLPSFRPTTQPSDGQVKSRGAGADLR